MGRVIGAAGGPEVGAADAASALVPVAGPAIAVGLVGAALLSPGGAAEGAALENTLENGLPKDELFVYEEALRLGFSLVVVTTADAADHEKAVATLDASGAESVDIARERWWIGLREIEAFEYSAEGLDFELDEPTYRLGFEAALASPLRGKPYRDVMEDLKERYPSAYRDAAFRRGYDRGRVHYRRLRESRSRAPSSLRHSRG